MQPSIAGSRGLCPFLSNRVDAERGKLRPHNRIATHRLRVGERGLFFLGDGGDGRFDDVEAFVELRVGDHERNENADHVVECARGDRDQSVFVAKFGDLLCFGVGWFARFGVADKFDGTHAAETAHFTDELPFLLPGVRAFREVIADRGRASEQAFFFDGFDRGETRLRRRADGHSMCRRVRRPRGHP